MTRDDVCAAARDLIGLTAPSPNDGPGTPWPYLVLVAPAEVAAGNFRRAHEIAAMSDCERVWEGHARRVWSLPTAEPYVTGRAFEDAYRLAGGSPWHPGGACRLATFDAPPQPGDGLVWGAFGNAVAHVDACVLDVGAYGSAVALSVVAGGQRDEYGRETIKQLARTVRWSAGRWIDMINGRPLLAIFDADAMSELYP